MASSNGSNDILDLNESIHSFYSDSEGSEPEMMLVDEDECYLPDEQGNEYQRISLHLDIQDLSFSETVLKIRVKKKV